jgi:multicomponent Na+:H+ antiporter subunit D
MVGSTLGLVLLGVSLTVFAGPLFKVSDQAARDMLDRSSYIQAVLGHEASAPLVLTSGVGK